MKKVKLIIAAAAMLSLVSSPAVYADGFAPGEGLYVGGFASGEMGLVQAKVTTLGVEADAQSRHDGGTFENVDGGLGLSGVTGGILGGYGYRMGDMYAGLEGEHSWGDVKFKVTSTVGVQVSGGAPDTCKINCGGDIQAITEIEATKLWTGGLFGRLGYYVNPDTLLAFKGGVLVSKFNAKVKGTTDYTEDYYGGGPSFGASLSSRVTAIDPNLSVRIGAVYTDFLTASVFGIGGSGGGKTTTNRSGHDSEVTGSALSARIGLQYSFFDINSLF